MERTKNVLVVYYSQSGQLKTIAEKLVEPFAEEDVAIEWLAIKPKTDFPFPEPKLIVELVKDLSKNLK